MGLGETLPEAVEPHGGVGHSTRMYRQIVQLRLTAVREEENEGKNKSNEMQREAMVMMMLAAGKGRFGCRGGAQFPCYSRHAVLPTVAKSAWVRL